MVFKVRIIFAAPAFRYKNIDLLYLDIQSTGQKSHCVNTTPAIVLLCFNQTIGLSFFVSVLSWLLVTC